MLDTPIDELHFPEAPDVGDVPGPKSRQLIDRQDRIDSNAVKYADSVPIAPDEARGATIRDVDGNTFLDFFAGIGVVNVGHSNPYVVEAANQQTETLIQTLDFPTEARLDLIDRLVEIAPGDLPDDARVIFGGPTGSNAIEASIKLAKDATGGKGMIAFQGGYHGSTTGAMSLSSKRSGKTKYGPLLPDVVHVRYPHPHKQGISPAEASTRSLEEIRTVLEDPMSGHPDPAGVWVEAIQGEGGVVEPPAGFLSELETLTTEHDVPLIVDEIQSGLGRTGKWFASEWDGVTPDIMPLGKALGGIGLPLSGVVYSGDLDTWDPGSHTGTFRGNVPAMRAGLRSIEYIAEHDLLTHARELGEYIRGRLDEVAVETPCLGDVRGKGLFIGAEFDDCGSKSGPELVDEIQTRCLREGAIVWKAGRRNEVLRLLPPLVMTEAQAAVGLDIICDAIERTVPTKQSAT